MNRSTSWTSRRKREIEVIGLGQCSVDYLGIVSQYPPVDTKIEALEWTTQGGGPVATALVTLARLGVKTAFIGKVGDDELGKSIRLGLTSEGVNVDGLRTDRGRTSQTAFIAVEKDTGRRTIFWTRGTIRPVSPDAIPLALVRQSRVLHLDGLMTEAALEAARIARDGGVTVVFDAGHVRPGTEDLLRHASHVIASEEFAREYGGKRDPVRIAGDIKRLGPDAVTITLGNRGCVTVSARDRVSTPAFRVPVVDTTGAGDVFHGAYIYGLLQGWTLVKSVLFATAAAGIKCRALGGRSGLPCLDEIHRLVRTRSSAWSRCVGGALPRKEGASRKKKRLRRVDSSASHPRGE